MYTSKIPRLYPHIEAGVVTERLITQIFLAFIITSFLRFYSQFSQWESLWTPLWALPQWHGSPQGDKAKMAVSGKVRKNAAFPGLMGHRKSLSWCCKFLTVSDFSIKQLCRFLFIASLLFPQTPKFYVLICQLNVMLKFRCFVAYINCFLSQCQITLSRGRSVTDK